MPPFPYHLERSATVRATPAEVFAFLDDPRKLSGHMASRSAMMLGSSMHIETDERGGRGVGAPIRLSGQVLGIPIRVDEEVTEYRPPIRKEWATRGRPRLLVIGAYRMAFDVSPTPDGALLRIRIDYELPPHRGQRWLGRLLGARYARWCTERMLRDAIAAFAEPRVLPAI